MREDAEYEAERLKEAAVRDAERLARRLQQDPDLHQELIRQDNVMYGGLMAIGIVMVQPFLTAESLDTAGTICVVAFAVAIPLLAALILVNRQETFRNRRTTSRTVVVATALAQAAAGVGLVAGFWGIHWIAGTAVLVSAAVAIGVHSAGFMRLESGTEPAPDAVEAEEAGVDREAEEPGATTS